jgi:glutamate/tyrosine decarboxylase-like PLP-dependent enzyme
MCDLVGYDRGAVGYSCYGAAASVLYAVRAGVERALSRNPGSSRDKVRIFKSARAHRCSLKAAEWLGLAPDAVVEVSTVGAKIDPEDLRRQMREAIRAGYVIGCVLVEAGSTYEFAIDDVGAVAAVCHAVASEYALGCTPYLHVDAAVAGIYSVFNSYDVAANPLAFTEDTLGAISVIAPALRAMNVADSIGIDFHKLGFCPLGSALHLVRDLSTLTYMVPRGSGRADIWPSKVDEFDPSAFTIEYTRSAAGVVAALCNIVMLGRLGYQRLLGHSLGLAMRFRSLLSDVPFCQLLNESAPGPAVVFRLLPRGPRMAAEDINSITERVFHRMRSVEGALSLSLLGGYRVHGGETGGVSVIKGFFIAPVMTQEDVAGGVKALLRSYELEQAV